MGTKQVNIFRLTCDGRPRLDCWERADYDSLNSATDDGWEIIGNKVLCPYCAMKEKDGK